MENISFYKPWLKATNTAQYKGGKSRTEIQSNQPIYKLSSNENLLGASPLALQAIRDNLHLLHEYPDRKGRSLQIALSNFYKKQLSPEQIITANSGVGIIELIVYAFLGTGLECIVTNPAFKPYMLFSQKVGAKVIDVPLEGDNFSINIEDILKAINERTRVIWLCSPNNPTGTHIPKAQIEMLLDQLPSHVILVYDEVYYQFATAADYTTALPFVMAGKNIIGINSFSKAYGLAGMRVGYGYSTLEIAQYINQVRRPFMLNTLALKAAEAALQDTTFIHNTLETIRIGKIYLYGELDKLGVKYWKSQTNFILLKPEMDAKEFEQKMLQEGVMVRPVANFGAPGCVRVTIGTPDANQAFIQALQNIIQ